MFKEMHTNNDQLPIYKIFEAKLLSNKTIIRFITEDCGEVLALEGHRVTFGDSKNH
jgi:uncharacterized protein YlaI